jgi:phosphoglycerate kinase
MLTMNDLDLNNKRVIIRMDLNVPIEQGRILNDARLKAVLPTLQLGIKKNARMILLSHLGRPKEGESSKEYSLKPVAERLSQLLNYPVRFEDQWLEGINIDSGEIVLCENVRFNVGEEKNDPALAEKLAALGDIFIMDAFGTAHRAQASTVGIIKFIPIAAAGPLLTAELNALKQALQSPKRPLVAIVGGAKVSDKLKVLESLLNKVNVLIVGGGIANTFIAALGKNVGASLFEPNLIDEAKKIMDQCKKQNIQLIIPQDVWVDKMLSAESKAILRNINEIQPNEKIGDVGPKTMQSIQQTIETAGTVLWNGPLGIFEYESFAQGTQALAKALAQSQAFSIAGGGETLAAIDKFGITSQISYISTGGGAFLEYIEGKALPAVVALEEKKTN